MAVAFDPSSADLTIGIVGAGVMGRGIAQIAAEAGITVLLADMRPEAIEEAKSACAGLIRRKAEKGQITADAAEAAIGRIHAAPMGEGGSFPGFAPCHLVVEAVAERMEIKHSVLAQLEAVVSDACVIATNTSSLSVTGFAAKARIPERVAGFHFFNPVPLMKVVEVIGGVLTDVAVLDALSALARRMGHTPVRATDTPGFLVNHAGRAYGTEALRIVQEGIAGFADVDRVMTEAAGFRMGPFELLDLTGLDVSHLVIESIYRQYYEEPRYRPVPITAQRHAAGLFGRKVGRGFYRYPEGRPADAPEEAVPLEGVRFWVSNRIPEFGEALRRDLEAAGVEVVSDVPPDSAAVAVLTPLGEDTTTAALAEGVDPTRAVAVDMVVSAQKRRTLMRTPVTDPQVLAQARTALAATGAAVTAIHDSPGFVGQRMLAAIVNVGCDIAQQRIATPGDIDRAVELGLGYPKGPLKLGDAIGPARVLAILEAMHAFYGDPRYRPSPWLKRRARLGVSLTQPEN